MTTACSRLRGFERVLDGVVGRQAGVGERHSRNGVQIADRDKMARPVDDHVLGHRPGMPSPGGMIFSFTALMQ